MSDPYAPPPAAHPPPPPGHGPPGHTPYAPYAPYAPYPAYLPPPPPPRRPLDKQVVALALVIALIVTVGLGTVAVSSVSGGIERQRSQARAQRQQERAAAQAFDDALTGPADTATASPAPDGTRRYVSPPVEDGHHGFRLRLPRGWEGRHVGVRQNVRAFSDSVLTSPGTGAVVVIDRIRFGVPLDSPRFEEVLRADLEGGEEDVLLTSRLTPTTVGDGEPAQHVFAEVAYDDGDRKRVRVVVFEHGGETFEVVQLADLDDWGSRAPQMDRILASWRWG